MRVDRKKFLAMLNATKPALGGSGATFSFRDGFVRTFNEEMFVEAEIPKPLEGSFEELNCTVPSIELLQLLKSYRTKEIVIEQEGDQIIVCSGKSEVGLNIMNSDPIPFDLDGIDNWKPVPVNLRSSIEFCVDTASSDLSKIELCDISIRNNTVLSTDGFRMTRCQIEDNIEDFSITKDSGAEIIKFEITNYFIGDKWIFFCMDDRATIIGCRLTMDNIPELDGFFESFDSCTHFTLPDDLNTIVERLMTLAPKDIDPSVQIKLDYNRMEFDLEGRNGWINEEAPINYDGDDVIFNINPQYLKQKNYGKYECSISETILYIRYNEYIERLIILYN